MSEGNFDHKREQFVQGSAGVHSARATSRVRVLLLSTVIACALQAVLIVALAEVGLSFAVMGTLDSAVAAPLADDDGRDWGDDDDDDFDPYLVRRGLIVSRPLVQAGEWAISDTTQITYQIAFVADDNTLLHGSLSIGECAEVTVAQQAPTLALKIVEKSLERCVPQDDDDGYDWDHDDVDQFKRWEGTIITAPAQLIGVWELSLGESKVVTFATDLATVFEPAVSAEYAVGRLVNVRVKRQLDGSLLAERVRLDDYVTGEIVVRVTSPAVSDTIAGKYGLVLTSTLLNDANIYLFTTKSKDEQRLVSKISREQGVIWAEVNYVNGVPEDDGYKTWGWGGVVEPDAYSSQSAYQQIRLGHASRNYQGEGMVVAVLDTGIHPQHEQFAGRLRLPSLDVMDDDDDPSEVGPGLAWGHGTHVAGVIAAIAPGAALLPVRVLDEDGRGNTFLLAYAIEWASQQPGVKVINLSLGTQFDSDILRDVIEEVTQQGILVVAAAGNNNTHQMQYPAAYPDVIGVTAVDENSLKATFANYGSSWVDVAAPGVNIMSTMISENGSGYATWSGTSMATAFVSGAAVLVAEKWQTEEATIAEMANQIVESGLVLDALNPDFPGQIGRQLDVSAALNVDAELLYMPQSEK